MKLIIFIISVIFVWGCHSSKKIKDSGKPVIAAYPDSLSGRELVAKSDCLTCHKIDEKIVGPSYRQVADRYAAMPDTIVSYLAKKIVKGGKGNWGEVFMTPHPGFSQTNAREIIKFILSLKNKQQW